MALVYRPAGYTGTLQQLTWAQGNNVSATAYLWGGGGGGGGNDTGIGGSGSGGQYSQVNFVVSEGDVLELAVGGPGQGGASYSGNAAGGSPGASFTLDTIFNTRTATPASGPGGPVAPQWNSRYCTFLNTNGVWISPSSAATFDKTYNVTFPVTGYYQFQASADNQATFYADGVQVFTAYDYTTTYEVGYPVVAGTYAIRIIGTNTGGPASVALVISSGNSYSGGRGGNSGAGGSSGAGGGGGGATVLLKNGTVIGVSGGGGGGGGGGNRSPINGDAAPGITGQAAPGQNPGQNGTQPLHDGGGGGGGGGGLGGGNGGYVRPGDQGANAGSFGGGFGVSIQNPNQRTPGGATSSFYVPNIGQGGSSGGGNGVSGYAMMEFDVNGVWLNLPESSWTQTKDVFVRTSATWNKAQGIWIKNNGVWEPIISSYAPNWSPVSGKFGINPRSATPDIAPEPPSYTPDIGGYDGGGGGGSKVICTALYQMGMMPEELYDHDQRFGKWLYENDPVAYKGYRKWADVLVEYMQGRGKPLLPRLMFWKTPEQKQDMSHKIALRVGNFVGYSFAQEIARRAGHKVPFSIGGWLIVSVGLKVCKAIGYAYGLHKSRKKK